MSDKLARRRQPREFEEGSKALVCRTSPKRARRAHPVGTSGDQCARQADIARRPAWPLAREHGFAGWTELKHKLTADAEETQKALGLFEEMAEVLLEAYRTGTPAAMERHWALPGTVGTTRRCEPTCSLTLVDRRAPTTRMTISPSTTPATSSAGTRSGRWDSLEQITLVGCAGVTNPGLAHLSRLPGLRELRVSGPQISPDIVGDFPSRVRVRYSV